MGAEVEAIDASQRLLDLAEEHNDTKCTDYFFFHSQILAKSHALINLGRIQQKLNNLPKAVEYFQQALEVATTVRSF